MSFSSTFHQIVTERYDRNRQSYAMPVLEADVYGDVVAGGRNPLLEKPFGKMLEALDNLQRNEVYICSGSSHKYALWGGLMSAWA